MRTAFIGGGTMAEAMLKGVLARGVAEPQAIAVSDIRRERLAALAQTYGVRTSDDNRRVLEGSEVVVLAVKPQNLEAVLGELKGAATPEQLVLSIVAGAKVATIVGGLTHQAVVRAMPNTPAQIGEGMTVWTASDAVSHGQKEAARAILEALGGQVYVPSEDLVDMATAISGSGPAYFFLMMEALVDAAVGVGVPSAMAEELVLHTALGAARLATESGKHPSELREMVTSPGGTTEKALACFEEGGFRPLVARAVVAAYERAKELGG